MDMINVLPVECVSTIFSLTSPQDACQLSLVSSSFKAIADSDAVWENFLPSDYEDIIDKSSTPTLNLLSKKQIYSHLSNHHVLSANGEMTLSLEKATGKKCCMVSTRGLKSVSGITPTNFLPWKSVPESRFSNVAEFKSLWLLEVVGTLETKLLSSNTNYGVYLIFNLVDQDCFTAMHAELVVHEGRINESRTIVNQIWMEGVQRKDGWKEIQMGEFFNRDEDNSLDFTFRMWNNVFGEWGVTIEGVEFRPKNM